MSYEKWTFVIASILTASAGRIYFDNECPFFFFEMFELERGKK